MNKNRLFLDIHAIQVLPPSNVNRDDTGSPKTAEYGGVRRARVSSQSWKREMRKYFIQNMSKEKLGIRTVEIVKYLSDILVNEYSVENEKANDLSKKIFRSLGISLNKDDKAKALFFLGYTQAKKLAEAALNNNFHKNTLESILKDNASIDISLFGRMVADNPKLDEDASSQVAHAISTHSVNTEFDFYTALDDLKPEDSQGAGMLGNVEFNSSTLYRYANVALHEFKNQIKDKELFLNSVELFTKSFALTIPSGKINSFANQTLPQFLMISLRSDRPVSLVSAFENPVKSDNGYVEKSVKKLVEENKKILKFVEKPAFEIYLDLNDLDLDLDSNKSEDFNNLTQKIREYLLRIFDELDKE